MSVDQLSLLEAPTVRSTPRTLADLDVYHHRTVRLPDGRTGRVGGTAELAGEPDGAFVLRVVVDSQSVYVPYEEVTDA